MAIKDFSQDGLQGGGGNPDSGYSGGYSGAPTGGTSVDDSGMRAGEGSGFQQADSNPGGALGTALAGGFDSARSSGGVAAANGGRILSRSSWDTGADNTPAPTPSTAAMPMANAFHFADGGSVDDSDGGEGSDVGSLLALALSSVDAGLDFGRKKYGLSQDKGQQQAAMGRMPAIPGNQSESGMPRPQPMPGPLPPTSNPFGQRKQFSQGDGDQDDQGTQTAQAGAIPDNDADDEGTA